MSDIDRDVFKGVGPDGIDVRVYSRDSIDLPSVTTILKTRDQDKSGLKNWQDENDGEGNNAFHEHLFWNSRHRGTLSHWHALSSVGDVPWSEDEADSHWALRHIADINNDEDITAEDEQLGEFIVDGSDHPEVHSSTPREVLYSVLKNKDAIETWGEFYDRYGAYNGHKHYSAALADVVERDLQFFTEVFDRFCNKLDIEEEDIIAVEEFLFDEEYGYAGQVDLVYEDSKGRVVVADLKTSSGCYEKHKMQGAAYGKAVERAMDLNVDRIEVWRIHPDSGQYAIHSHDASVSGLHTDDYWYKGLDDLWEDFRELAENFDYEHTE